MRMAVMSLVLSPASRAAAQTTWYVDDDNCPGPGTSTQGDPFCQIQSAVDAAVDGDAILVLPGVYAENVDFAGKALTLDARDGADATRIAGHLDASVLSIVSNTPKAVAVRGFTITGGKGNPVDFDNLESAGGGVFASGVDLELRDNTIEMNTADAGGGVCVIGGSATVIAGNRISDNAVDLGYGGGLALLSAVATIDDNIFDGNSSNEDYYGGGGLYARQSRIAVAASEFAGNTAGSDGNGSAIRCVDGACVISHCWIHDNGASLDYGVVDVRASIARVDTTIIENNLGFGLFVDDRALITRCDIRGNIGVDAGGIWLRGSSVIRDCVIENNLCTNLYSIGPGGIRIDSASGSAIFDCVIRSNRSEDGAGGIAIDTGAQGAVVLGCRVEGNVGAAATAGGIDARGAVAVIENCVLIANSAPKTAALRGFAITVVGCTITQNVCPTGSATSGTAKFVNTIIWGNDTAQQLTPNEQARYCDIQGGWIGLGILDVDPLFVSPGTGDVHLSPGSFLIDRGWKHNARHIGVDIDGDARIRGLGMDIGADEAG